MKVAHQRLAELQRVGSLGINHSKKLEHFSECLAGFLGCWDTFGKFSVPSKIGQLMNFSLVLLGSDIKERQTAYLLVSYKFCVKAKVYSRRNN